MERRKTDRQLKAFVEANRARFFKNGYVLSGEYMRVSTGTLSALLNGSSNPFGSERLEYFAYVRKCGERFLIVHSSSLSGFLYQLNKRGLYFKK